MANTKSEPKQKKSQKRADRQARRAERQRLRMEQAIQKTVHDKYEPIRVRLSKKSLPGFLAKNVDAIIQWLKDYQLLYIASDDYGFLNMERFPEARMKHVMANYVQLVDFITQLETIKNESQLENTAQLSSSIGKTDDQINNCLLDETPDQDVS